MPFINHIEKEIAFKVVYFGPGLSGKTTNLLYIHRSLDPERCGELFTLDTAEERTLFFDFFPLDLGDVQGYRIRFHLYTVPGQDYYEASRRLILEGVDGVVFVADSQPERFEENLRSFRQLQECLSIYGEDPGNFPLVLQYNKRDLPEPLPPGTLEAELGLNGLPVFEAVALEGRGVMETIRTLARELVMRFEF